MNALIHALEEMDLLCQEQREGKTRYFVSGEPREFEQNGQRFLDLPLAGKVEKICAE